MNNDEQKNTGAAACCYIPYIGMLVSIYNLLTDNKREPYCRFHSYHSLFLWIAISFIIIAINILGFVLGYLPFVGPFLANITSIAQTVIHGGVIVYGIFCAYNAYQGSSFSIPYITEFTNKYLEEKKMLP
jgi:uncharacterized membrane protein